MSDKNRANGIVNASSYARENLESLENSELYALKEAGLIDKEALEVLLSMKRGLKHTDTDYRKTEAFKEIIEYQTSKTVGKAVKEENLGVLSHFNGRTSEDKSISQFHRYRELQDIICVQGRTFIFSGDPDMGKTNLALLMAEIWKAETGGRVVTNMETVNRFKTVTNFHELKEEFEKDDKRILGIIEDASNHFSAYTVDRQMMEEKYRPFSNELAKNNGNMFLLGHTGLDIHADARRKAKFVHKPSLKKTEVYDRMKNGERVDKLLELTEIPKTSINYNSSEKTEWSWINMNETEETEDKAKIRRAISERLQKQNVVKTVEIPFANAKVAQEMREIAKNSSGNLRMDESSSPKRLKKKQI